MTKKYQHTSVLNLQLIEHLKPQAGQHFIDCTLGGGGHTEAILKKNTPDGRVLALDLDQDAVSATTERLKQYKDRLIVEQADFSDLQTIYKKHKDKLPIIAGIVADLGVSSWHFDQANRGFSFKDHGPLDMRFDPDTQSLTASEIVMTWPQDKLEKIFREYGDIKQAKKLATGLIAWRKTQIKQKQKPIKTSMLVDVILRIFNISDSKLKSFKIHPATRVWQALRIATNQEIDKIQIMLPQAFDILMSGGYLAIISFHSLEDRTVKQYFKGLAKTCHCPPESPTCQCDGPLAKIINKKIIKASEIELTNNPRSRSAILRVIQKI
jgi:16S rRNA (cytosine1402-N4)-methyltransferase